MKSALFILSGFLVLMGAILCGAAIENMDFSNLTNTYTIRSILGYSMFMSGAAIAAIGSFRARS